MHFVSQHRRRATSSDELAALDLLAAMKQEGRSPLFRRRGEETLAGLVHACVEGGEDAKKELKHATMPVFADVAEMLLGPDHPSAAAFVAEAQAQFMSSLPRYGRRQPVRDQAYRVGVRVVAQWSKEDVPASAAADDSFDDRITTMFRAPAPRVSIASMRRRAVLGWVGLATVALTCVALAFVAARWLA